MTRSLFLRNFIFTILHPGLIAGLIPWWILGEARNRVLNQPLTLFHYAYILLLIVGFCILTECIIRFAQKGKGTLSPADPTTALVITGLYQFSRNPMYVGVMMILLGEALYCNLINLWIYVAVIFIIFNLFIIFFEEPRLKKDFGDTYIQYCRRVNRWL